MDHKETDTGLNNQLDMYHSGILGMKWGLRRFQNPDGSLTEAGRARYGVGPAEKTSSKSGSTSKSSGSRQIRRLEKERARRQQILSDRKLLAKYANEFTKDELDRAYAKFESQDRIKRIANQEKENARRTKAQARIEKERAKAEAKQAKLEYKKQKLKYEQDRAQAREQAKQQRIENLKRLEQLQREEYDTKLKSIEAKAKSKDTGKTKADIWQNRSNKFNSIFNLSKTMKQIMDDVGISKSNQGSSVFGYVGDILGFKSEADKKQKEKRDKEDKQGQGVNVTVNIDSSIYDKKKDDKKKKD